MNSPQLCERKDCGTFCSRVSRSADKHQFLFRFCDTQEARFVQMTLFKDRTEKNLLSFLAEEPRTPKKPDSMLKLLNTFIYFVFML